MARRFSTVLLDVDGTLVDSNDAHAHAWVDTFARYDHDVPFSSVRRLIGMGGDRLIETLIGIERSSKQNEKIGHTRTEIFRERWLPTVRPLRGSRDLVLRLRAEGFQYAVASAAKSEELEPLLEIADIRDLIETRTTSSDVEHSKPNPEIIEAALAKLLLFERSQTVMVGDTPYDAQAARDAHVAMIGVTSGGWPPEQLSGAVGVYSGPDELARVFPF